MYGLPSFPFSVTCISVAYSGKIFIYVCISIHVSVCRSYGFWLVTWELNMGMKLIKYESTETLSYTHKFRPICVVENKGRGSRSGVTCTNRSDVDVDTSV